MCTDVTYTPYTTFSKEETGDIITFTQFEEGDLLSGTSENEESGEKSNNNSIMPPLVSKEEMDAKDSGDDAEDETMSMDMLEEIRDCSQSHQNINSREARYKICDCIKQRKS